MNPDDRRWLGLAFDLALRGLGETTPNPLVGAILVRDGRLIGSGYHTRAGEDHAETKALDEAGERARGASLYINLEPCSRHRLLAGRRPPCVEQVIAAGVRRVVAAARDPNPLIDGQGLQRLAQAGIEIEQEDPTFSRRAARLNEVFFKFMQTRIPFVALKAGMTLDGKIALASGASRWITSEAARAEGRALRRRYDAVLVGIGTVLADDPLLLADRPARDYGDGTPGDRRAPAGSGPQGAGEDGPGPGTRQPVRVVLDSRLRLPHTSRLAATAGQAPVIVYAATTGSENRQRRLEERGVTVVRGAAGGRVSIPALLADLAAREVTSVLVEGGGAVLGSFLRARHADKVHLFMASRILGGADAVPAFGGASPGSLDEAVAIGELEVRRVGGALLVEGYPVFPASGGPS